MSLSLWVHAGPCLCVPGGTDVEAIAGVDRFVVIGRNDGAPQLYLFSNSGNTPGRYYTRNEEMPDPLDVDGKLTTAECEEFAGFYEREILELRAALGSESVSLAWRIVAEWS